MKQNRRLELAVETLQAQVAAHEILIKALFDALPHAADVLQEIDVTTLLRGIRTELFVELVDSNVSAYMAN